ncbi:MAG: sigma-70 family RNA polymerase sigma factor [Xanthomonadales bacterium]|nr:sigma-70 family RNA polymerase sigma factor [Xanthomonadales bacterium]
MEPDDDLPQRQNVAASVPAWLARSRSGDRVALDRLFAELRAELKQVARRQRARLDPGETLCTTALVNELWMKLNRAPPNRIADREHFLAISAQAMREIVVDHARARRADKRGAGVGHLPLDAPDALQLAMPDDAAQVLAVDAAVQRLEALDPRLAQVVVWRYFAGLDEAEIAAALNVTERTVRRDWVKARTLLAELLGELS